MSGAAIALPGKSTVGSADLKRNAVRSKHIQSKAVRGSDVENDALKGKQVFEEKLEAVPEAMGGRPCARSVTYSSEPARPMAPTPSAPAQARRSWSWRARGKLTVYAKCFAAPIPTLSSPAST